MKFAAPSSSCLYQESNYQRQQPVKGPSAEQGRSQWHGCAGRGCHQRGKKWCLCQKIWAKRLKSPGKQQSTKRHGDLVDWGQISPWYPNVPNGTHRPLRISFANHRSSGFFAQIMTLNSFCAGLGVTWGAAFLLHPCWPYLSLLLLYFCVVNQWNSSTQGLVAADIRQF